MTSVRNLLFLLSFFLFLNFSSNSQTKVNNHKHQTIIHYAPAPGLTGFAFNNINTTNANFIKFTLAAPGTQTFIAGISQKRFYGADFNTFNQLFAVDGETAGTSSLFMVDTATGNLTLVGNASISAGQRMTGLTYDSTSSIWYGASSDGSTSVLYIVNSTNGALVFIGNIAGSPSVVSISCAKNGTLFGIDNVSNNLIKISKITGAGTVAGPLGITLSSYQGMDFNPITGILYLASNDPSPQLRTIDTTSGATTLIGNITGTTAVTGFAIPFSGVNAPPPGGACQSFNTSVFPPAGWVITDPSGFWIWATVTAYCLGYGSAEFDFYDASAGDMESLTSSIFSPANGTTDSVIFQEAYATYQTEDDQLQIRTSNDTGVTWTNLVLLHGGVSGELVTAPPQLDPFEPSCSQWKRQAFLLPAGTNRVDFQAISAFGNNLYVDSICAAGSPIGIITQHNIIPSEYKLEQNYPNPFNPSTNIGFRISRSGFVKLTVYDILGKEIYVIMNENKTPGSYIVKWDASNYPSGVYFYKLVVSEANLSHSTSYSETKKMILIK